MVYIRKIISFIRLYFYLYLRIACIIIATMAGCSPAVQKESVVDTPEEHYLSGMQKLQNDDLNAAETDFKRAIELNKKSPYGHTGMAFLELQKTNYSEALGYAKKALKFDRDFVDAYAVKGRIITTRKRGKTWFEDAIEPLEKALNLDPENHITLFFTAECYLTAQNYLKAHQFFVKALEKEGAYTVKAREREALLSKIIDEAPASENSGYVALDDRIDRSDLCVILIDELKVKDLLKHSLPSMYEKLYTKDSSGSIPPDVAGHRSKKWIRDIIPLRIIELTVFPNNYFYPDKIITRAQFALVMQDVMVLINGEPSLSTIYIGSESRFPDVRNDYYAFNAITLCIERGIMEADSETGDFNVDGQVSGVDAILMLRKLKKIFLANNLSSSIFERLNDKSDLLSTPALFRE
jgi:tetratricopeptide (TPR) repeat protein